MRPDKEFLTRAIVGSAIFGLENFPLKSQIFQFFPLGQKNLLGSGEKVPGSKTGEVLIYECLLLASGHGPSLM